MQAEMFNGLLNAPSEKRYKHFLSFVSDSECVWMVDCGNDNLLSPETDGISYYLAWSEKEFAEYYLGRVDTNAQESIFWQFLHHTMLNFFEKRKCSGENLPCLVQKLRKI